MPRSKRAALSPDTIDQARKHLAALPPPVPTSHTIRQAVDQLKSEITNLRDQGYTLAQIADHLGMNEVFDEVEGDDEDEEPEATADEGQPVAAATPPANTPGERPPTLLFNGRLAPPRDWDLDDS